MTRYQVWSKSPQDRWWMAVAEDLTKREAQDIADRKDAAAKRLGVELMTQVTKMGEAPQ